MIMTGRVLGLAVHVDSDWVWVGVCRLPGWWVVQPLPCIGVTWRRGPRSIYHAEPRGTWTP